MLVGNTAGNLHYVTVDDFVKLQVAEPFRASPMRSDPLLGWIVQYPSIYGYSGAFGYNLAGGMTIMVAATKSETATTDASAFAILREVVKYVTPASPINSRTPRRAHGLCSRSRLDHRTGLVL